MKHIIIGTAGHIDHGKTMLTKALTGVDTDRLKEEKERGITIVSGFAPLPLPGGFSASIVDVPGHEKFIRNMLSGATGMDVVLLTVAADEGFMPQTCEHLDILELLGIENGIVVLTKCDLVSPEALETVKSSIPARVKGTFLEEAPIVPVSAVTGAGLEILKEEIVRLVSSARARHTDRAFRLPTDRAFPVSGFGTVVTGTLSEGSVRVGEEIMVYPSGSRARVRELQNHDSHVGRAFAGMRTAVSLTGGDRDALFPGCILAKADSMFSSLAADVLLKMAPDAAHEIRNSTRLHFYCGTKEQVCTVRLLDCDHLGPGESGFVQIKFTEPLIARNYDRFILRFLSPVITVGGGTILDLEAVRHRRNDPAVMARLEALSASDPLIRLKERLKGGRELALTIKALSRLENMSADELYPLLSRLVRENTLVLLGQHYVLRERLEEILAQAKDILGEYHRENPLEPGMHLGELREKLFPQAVPCRDAVLNWFSEIGALKNENGYVALKDFRPEYDAERARLRAALLAAYAKAGYTPPDSKVIAADFKESRKIYSQVMADLLRDGLLVALSPTVCIHRSALQLALDIFLSLFSDSENVTLADFRTAADISRKFAQPLLEYWDRCGICRREGEGRILLKKGNDTPIS